MVDMQQLENIKQKHGRHASWAVWADTSEKPKSNMGDVSHFKNESVLSFLKKNIVMVGLNISYPKCYRGRMPLKSATLRG